MSGLVKVTLSIKGPPSEGDRYGSTLAEFDLGADALLAFEVYQAALARLVTPMAGRIEEPSA